MMEVLPVYIGYDEREDEAYRVCRYSISRHSSQPVYQMPLKLEALRSMGLMKRPVLVDRGQRIDGVDHKPFSTDFSFTRFLVPALMQYDGWALFCDCDFLFTADLADLFAHADERYAVMVVKHDHVPTELTKMDGQRQTTYRRKNWSSLVLWNCAHPSNRGLIVSEVNRRPGSWLHAFDWLRDGEIGALPADWNFLIGVDEAPAAAALPRGLHFTSGGPWFENYRDVPFADVWRLEQSAMLGRPKANGALFEATL